MVITAHHQCNGNKACDDIDLIESTCIGQYSEIPTTPTNDPIGIFLIVAKSETVYIFLDEEIREEHAFPGHEQMVSSFRLYLIVVTFIKTKMASNKNRQLTAAVQTPESCKPTINEITSNALYYKIHSIEPQLADKIATMFTDAMIEKDIQNLLDNPTNLQNKVNEAIIVLNQRMYFILHYVNINVHV